ncbi:MAG: MerR family transcriptional regulator [Bacillota bacterium]
MKYYKTSEIAREVKVHPNTVRLYEAWGLLQSVPRNSKGYRLYSERHLEQMRLSRIALKCDFCAGNIRKLATHIVKTAAEGDIDAALNEAYEYRTHVKSELSKAEEALAIIQKWISGELYEATGAFLKRKDTAGFLGVSIDVLRSWERNGLIDVPRNPANGYREYGNIEIIRLKVIRTLRSANYSMMAILKMLKHIDFGKQADAGSLMDIMTASEDMRYATDYWITTLKGTEKDTERIIDQLIYMKKNFT